MTDEQDMQADEPEYVTLIDRAGGPGEFWFAGRPWTFTKSKPTRVVPIHVAMWLLVEHRNRVWTTDGQFVHRFTVKDGPESLLSELGEAAFDTSPIEIDTTRAEGWNTDEADRPDTRTIALKPRPGEFANQGAGQAPAFSGKER
jgi:hypothetical protein